MQGMHAWDRRLDLGDEALDEEHHLQVALVSALADALERGRPRVATRLADQLAGYSLAHFEGEQLLMDTSGYSQAGEHREEHLAMLAHIEEIRYLLGRAEYDLALPMSLDLLTGIGSHITASDRQFADFRAERRQRSAS